MISLAVHPQIKYLHFHTASYVPVQIGVCLRAQLTWSVYRQMHHWAEKAMNIGFESNCLFKSENAMLQMDNVILVGKWLHRITGT